MLFFSTPLITVKKTKLVTDKVIYLLYMHFCCTPLSPRCLMTLTLDHKITISEVRWFKVDRVVLFPYRGENLIRDVSRQGSVSMGTSDK